MSTSGSGGDSAPGGEKPPDKPDEKRSMREFDFFSKAQKPVGAEALARDGALPDNIASEALARAKRLRRAKRGAVFSTASFLACTWFVFSYRDLIGYAFAAPRPPQQLGDVTELLPEDIPHNAYVAVRGITEHRDIEKRVVRGLVPLREELWYFRLVGSRGVFIEVPPDRERYDVTTEVQVAGRAIDPARSRVHELLLDEYAERFHTEKRGQQRIIQVGLKPGEGRGAYYVLFLIMAGVATLQGWAISRWMKIQRESRGILR